MVTPKRRRTTESSESSKPEQSAAVAVTSDDNLLTAILLRLPLKPLVSFQLVSKRWLSLISAPYFSRCRRLQFPDSSFSGLFIDHSFVLLKNPDQNQPNSLISDENPLNPLRKALSLVQNLRILQSCNGLLLVSSTYWIAKRFHHLNYYIFNPTTQQLIPLPKPLEMHNESAIEGIALAFDPSKSLTYKVFCLRRVNPKPNDGIYQIEVYSSETGRWRVSGEPFPASFDFIRLNTGVFWNGSVHWGRTGGDALYVNVDDESVRPLPMPVTDTRIAKIWEGNWSGYFGESCGHLHLIDIYDDTWTWFNVYEMEMDYSGWFVKYRVDLGAISTAYPDMTYSFSDQPDLRHHALGLLGIVRGVKEEDSELVLYVEGKIVSYNFAAQSCKELCDFDEEPYNENTSLVKHGCCSYAFPFIEYLSRV